MQKRSRLSSAGPARVAPCPSEYLGLGHGRGGPVCGARPGRFGHGNPFSAVAALIINEVLQRMTLHGFGGRRDILAFTIRTAHERNFTPPPALAPQHHGCERTAGHGISASGEASRARSSEKPS
jgi:hypothetical protein